MAVVGAIGNLLTLFAIPWAQSNKILGFNRTPLKYTEIFIVNLAFSDFLYCITNLPMYSHTVSGSTFFFVFDCFFVSSILTRDGQGQIGHVKDLLPSGNIF